MKKIIIMALLLALLLVSCTTTIESDITTQPTTTQQATTMREINNADVVQTDIEGIFYLGQSPEDFLSILEDEGMQVEETRLTPGDRIAEWDGFFSFSSEEIRAWFNPDEQNVRFNILTPDLATNLGIRVGDNKERVFELYGNNFTNDPYEGLWYYYTYDDLTIGFLMPLDTVIWWNIFIPSDQPSRP